MPITKNSVRYEAVYLRAYDSVSAARHGIGILRLLQRPAATLEP
jgi:hypothetical protein